MDVSGMSFEIRTQNSGGLSQAKIHHLKTRHPKFRLDLVKESRKVKPVELSEIIPDSERNWTCPVCKKDWLPSPIKIVRGYQSPLRYPSPQTYGSFHCKLE